MNLPEHSFCPLRTIMAGTMVALGLLGCASAPRPEPLVAALPSSYPVAVRAQEQQEAAAPVLRWDDLFPDPDLHRLLQAALDYNSDLRASVARVEEARASAGLQRANSLPAIGMGAQGIRSRVDLPIDQVPSGALPQPWASMLQSVDRTQILSTYRAGVVLTPYEIDFWGKIRQLNQAARDTYLASAEAQQAFRTSLMALVTDTWLQGLELQERLALAHRTLAANEESHRIMRRRAAVGLISDMEGRQTESLVASTRADVAALERSLAQNRALLTQLTHLPDPPKAQGEHPLTRLADRPLPAGLPSTLLTRRPDIRAAEWQLRAARANVAAARAAFLPSVTLTGAGGAISDSFSNLFDHAYGAWLFVPSIHMPLFDGGRTQAHLDLAEARRNELVAQYESSIRGAFREVSELMAARHWLAEQERDVRELVAAQGDRERIALKRYDRGYNSYFEVLDAERSRFAAEQGLVQLHRARLSSLVGLYKALGGDAAIAFVPTAPAGAASASMRAAAPAATVQEGIQP